MKYEVFVTEGWQPPVREWIGTYTTEDAAKKVAIDHAKDCYDLKFTKRSIFGRGKKSETYNLMITYAVEMREGHV